MANKNRRIAKEIQDIHNDVHSKITVVGVHGDDLRQLRGTFLGPPDTPYEGGTFNVSIRIPDDYPFKAPVMKFETRLWHPNVSSQTVCIVDSPLMVHIAKNSQGAICLDTLGTAWSPVLTIKSALISLQSLLSSPEPKDPQDAEVASMMIKNPKEFEHKAREWAVKFAGAPKKELGESSGGATEDSLRRAQQEQKKKEEQVKLAA